MMNDPSGNNASPVGNRVDIEWEQSTQTTIHEDQLNPTYNPGVGSGGGAFPQPQLSDFAPADYSSQWNTILAGTGFSVGTHGLVYNPNDDQGYTITNNIKQFVGKILTIWGINYATKTPIQLLTIANQLFAGDLYTALYAPFDSMTLAPEYPTGLNVDLTSLSNPIGTDDDGHDADILTIGGDAVFRLGIGLSISLVGLDTGPDAGQTFLYKNQDSFIEGIDASIYAEVGAIGAVNGNVLDRNSFIGASQSYNLGLENGNGSFIIGYNDNQYHLWPFTNAAVFVGILVGLNIGALPISNTAGHSTSTIVPTYNTPYKP